MHQSIGLKVYCAALEKLEWPHGSGGRTADGAAATDAAAAAAVDADVAALNRDGIRELAKQKRNKEKGMRNGMRINDDSLALGDLATRRQRSSGPWRKNQAADAELRRVAETTAAGRGTGGRGRGGRGGPVGRIP